MSAGGETAGVADTPRARHGAFVLIIALGTVLRLWHFPQLPHATADGVRNLLWGCHVLQHGITGADQPFAALHPSLSFVPWSHVAYNYPILALGFFTTLAALSPTMLALRIALTLCDIGNAWLVGKVSGDRLLGAIYWAAPVTVWWGGRELQFEALQVLPMLLAVHLAGERRGVAAAVALGIAVQVKLTAAVLLPWLVWKVYRDDRRLLGAAALAFIASFAPSVLAQFRYSHAGAVLGNLRLFDYNPFRWNLFDSTAATNHGVWRFYASQFLVQAMAGLLVIVAAVRREWMPVVPALLFIVLLKSAFNAREWYLLVLPPLLVLIPEARARFGAIALWAISEPVAFVSILFGGWGYRAEWPAGTTVLTDWSQLLPPG